MATLNVVGIAGSLRTGSFNKSLLRAAAAAAPDGMKITVLSIDDIPVFNQDQEMSLPPAVQKLKDAVKNADAVVIATPEYNYSVPGVLKNAIDWLSRPYGSNSLDAKPLALMGASSGMLGSARAQYHLRQILTGLNVHTLNRPEIIVPSAGEKFDKEGNLTDEKTRQKLGEMLTELAAWTHQLKSK